MKTAIDPQSETARVMNLFIKNPGLSAQHTTFGVLLSEKQYNWLMSVSRREGYSISAIVFVLGGLEYFVSAYENPPRPGYKMAQNWRRGLNFTKTHQRPEAL